MEPIIIKPNNNLLQYYKPSALILGLLYTTTMVNYNNISLATVLYLMVILAAVVIFSLLIYISYKTEIIIDATGVREKSPAKYRFIKWENIRSIDVILKTRFSEDILKKEDHLSNIYLVGNKLIVLSDILKNQIYQSASTKNKRLFYIPFREDVYEILQERGFFAVAETKES